MTYANAQFKNSGNDEGDVLNFFNNTLRGLIQRNGGDNSFSIVEELCHDKDERIPIGTKTKLRLTHSGHTISQIEKGFIRILLNLELQMNKPYTGGDIKDTQSAHLNMLFVGFKDAASIISELQFWVDGKLVDNYHQNDHVREAFAYNMIRAKDDKTNAPHTHSLWESVCSMSPNVAGVYIPMELFDPSNNKGVVKAQMELVIPFTDHLALQAWRLYPNRIIGEMEEEVKFSLDGLVWCQVPPKKVGDIKKFWDCNPTKEYNAPDLPITHHFTQIGQEAIIVNKVTNAAEGKVHNEAGHYYAPSSIGAAGGKLNVTDYQLWRNRLEVNVNHCEIEKCRTNCAGFGVKPDVVQGILEALTQPLIIPAQELTRHQFETHITETDSSINISKSVPLRNATNITMMFPAHSNDYTVFKNIMCTDVRLSVNKKLYPETAFETTWDGRFVQYQLMASELEGATEPTDELVESLSRPLNNVYQLISANDGATHTEGERFLMCPFDNTSFGINFQLERGNAGYVFDGIDSGSSAVSIEFRANKKFHDKAQRNDVLSYPDVTCTDTTWISVLDTTAEVIPEMWICSDTYWTWDTTNGVTYYSRGRPTGYE